MNDETAVNDIRQRGKAGINYIFKKYSGRLKKYFENKCKLSPADADDVLQETLWRFFDSVRKGGYQERGQLSAFLFKIAKGEVIRNRQKQPPEETNVYSSDIDDESEDQPFNILNVPSDEK